MVDDAPWYSTLDPELQAHITAKGFDKDDLATALPKVVKSWSAAEKHIGVPADQLLRLPKDASDPAYQAAYDRIVGMSAPKEAAEYKFDGIKFSDGTDVAESEQEFVRNIAAKHKLPVAVARDIAQSLVARADEFASEDARTFALTRDANAAVLRQMWGGEFEAKSLGAMRALEAVGFSKAILEHMATLPTEEYVANMNAAYALGGKMGEAQFHAGGGGNRVDPTAGMTPDAARTHLDALQGDQVWRDKFFKGDAATVAEWTKLTQLIASGRVPRS
jgi:hypothetical protein